MSILEGSIQDVFNYTRKLKLADKMMVFIKCNLIMKNEEQKINTFFTPWEEKDVS